jgi:hypothetical protein
MFIRVAGHTRQVRGNGMLGSNASKEFPAIISGPLSYFSRYSAGGKRLEYTSSGSCPADQSPAV